MDKTLVALLVAIFLSAVGALADYFLKLASEKPKGYQPKKGPNIND